MYRSLLYSTLLLFLAAPLATAADRDTEQLRAGFDSSYFNQFKTNDPEGFAKVEGLVEGMAGYIGETLPKQIETVRNPTNEFKINGEQLKLKALLACSDLPPNFDKIKSKATITAKAAATYRLAFDKCRMARGLLAPYLNKHPVGQWFQLANLVPWPEGMERRDADKAYDADIEARYEEVLATGAPSTNTTTQSPDISADEASENTTFNAGPEGAPPLPPAPYSFNWDEIAMIRKQVAWALETHDPESRARYGLQECTDMLDAPKGAYTAFRTITFWSEQCGKKIALSLNGDHGENLMAFGKHYKAAFIEFEEILQKDNMSKLPPLPAQPYLFQPVEIKRYRDYMGVASASSLLLQAALETSINSGDVCGRTDPSLLKTDLDNPFVRDNWMSYVGRLMRCAKNIQQAYPLAGDPLMKRLMDYRAALQAKPVKSLFN